MDKEIVPLGYTVLLFPQFNSVKVINRCIVDTLASVAEWVEY